MLFNQINRRESRPFDNNPNTILQREESKEALIGYGYEEDYNQYEMEETYMGNDSEIHE